MPERRNRPASRVYVETELELEEPAEDGGRYILEDLERLTVFHNNTSDRFVDLERLTVSPISRLVILWDLDGEPFEPFGPLLNHDSSLIGSLI